MVVEVPAPPASGAFAIRVHDPLEWREPRGGLPWLPLTLIFDLPHLQASFQSAPGEKPQSGLLLVDTGARGIVCTVVVKTRFS